MARSELTPQDKSNQKKIALTLNELSNSRQVSQAEISRATKIPAGTLNGYFKGTSLPSPGNVQKLADFFNIFKSDIDPRFEKIDNVIPITKTVKIPLLGEIACGDPILAEENIEEYIDEPVNYLPSGTCFYLKAKGDSMKPTIPSGSKVLIRQQPDVEDDEIAAVLMTETNEATLKRIKRSNGTMFLMPDNPEFTPIIVGEDNPVRILGKAIRYTSDL
ncbi:S24 family peptidase [Liquorilactobacillus mali]|uniref:LexA family protein n=1 Tax=Liquorilactobacillus mali TaxID=1618 RepID=UPI0026549651|nr:S24 family peptidase [Liquorilactobacillus mali]MDN7145306.1 S24 family peptidase [Liquorilactobacillus mali]